MDAAAEARPGGRDSARRGLCWGSGESSRSHPGAPCCAGFAPVERHSKEDSQNVTWADVGEGWGWGVTIGPAVCRQIS